MIKPSRSFCLPLASVFLLAFLFSACGERAVSGKRGMVVSVDETASRVGVEILKKGGNAVDAAVAVGFALAVTYPAAGNIGGGGFMIIKDPDAAEAAALDFRERAPGAATAGMYLDEKGEYIRERSISGYLAVGVPGTVRGFELAMKRYGSMEWQDVIQPAVRLAEEGFRLSRARAESFNRVKRRFRNATPEFHRIFTNPDGSDFKSGELFIQKDLARSLRLIAERGAAAFYEGEIAQLIVKDMHTHGGLISLEDLRRYRAVERRPVTGTFRGYEIVSMPPPSSGGTILIEMLNILEGFDLAGMGRYSPEALHVIAESMRLAYYDRARFLGDSDFYDVPVAQLISKDYAAQLRSRISLDTATKSIDLGREILTLAESPETTHYSVIDERGLAVATTYTLNGGFGAGVVAAGTGILLNNEMDDFNKTPGLTDDQGLIGTEANLIQPYKRMLSSMTPTLILKDGRIFLITGSPGGRTIINTVLNVILNILEFQMPVQDAVNAPRMNHEWMPDVLRLEKEKLPQSLLEALEARGHVFPEYPWRQGDAHTIMVDPETGVYYGAPDRRSRGFAAGY